jgi:hypothetical protein
MKLKIVGLVLLTLALFSFNSIAQPGKGGKVQEIKALKLSGSIASSWAHIRVNTFEISKGILQPTKGNKIFYLLAERKFEIGAENRDFSVSGKGEVTWPGGARFTCNGCGDCEIKEEKNADVTHYTCVDKCKGDCNGRVTVPDNNVLQIQTASGEWHELPRN